ncbi:MAG: hypothetical protein F4Y81_05990 [Rhodothermaceae bacterium]|nr:hypothetical protein [Rhodothermaceae bacterium]MYG68701.1 hypothetical protein [Rhodothermaceae bacterium]
MTKPSWGKGLPEKDKNYQGLWLIIEQDGEIPIITLSQGECQRYSENNTSPEKPKDMLGSLVESTLQGFNGNELIIVFQTDEGKYPEEHTDDNLVYETKTAVKAAFGFTFYDFTPEIEVDRFITTNGESVIPLRFQSNVRPIALSGYSNHQLESRIGQTVNNLKWLTMNRDKPGIQKLTRVINESYDSPSKPSTYSRIWATMDTGKYGQQASRALGIENWRNSQTGRISTNPFGAQQQKKHRDELSHAFADAVNRELFESLQKDVFHAICRASETIDEDRK